MRRDEAWLLDIVLAARHALEFVDDVSREQFNSDFLVQSAVMRQLTIVGEAANKVSKKFRDNLSDIPWSRIVAFRNRLVHGYFNIDINEVWSVLQYDLQPLIDQLEPFIPREDELE